MTPQAAILYMLFMGCLAGCIAVLVDSTLCYFFQTDATFLAVLGVLIGVLVVAFLDTKFTRLP